MLHGGTGSYSDIVSKKTVAPPYCGHNTDSFLGPGVFFMELRCLWRFGCKTIFGVLAGDPCNERDRWNTKDEGTSVASSVPAARTTCSNDHRNKTPCRSPVLGIGKTFTLLQSLSHIVYSVSYKSVARFDRGNFPFASAIPGRIVLKPGLLKIPSDETNH